MVTRDELVRHGEASFRERVYEYVRRIPRGRVTTYGEIAAELGTPRAARVVGGALHALPPGTEVPWHRVINASGRISIKHPEHAALQERLLHAEGVQPGLDGTIDLRRFGWSPAER